ncbi:MAG TPA: folate-binding protein [Dokdonella sp.]
MNAIALGAAEVLTLSGADAIAFTHAQFTSDVAALEVGRWQWSAWLDAQGRARHVFALLRVAPERLLAWLPLGGAASMHEALRRFVLRAKVELAATSDWSLARWTGEVPHASTLAGDADGFVLRQPGAAPRAARIGPAERAAIATAHDELERWRREDVAAGLPLLAPALAAEFVPQALALERIDAIRFDKGCYPGQEIAARLHFRGGNKRHLHRLRIRGRAPEPAAPILAEAGRTAGRVLYAAHDGHGEGVALAVLDAAAADAPRLVIGDDAEIVARGRVE